MSGPFVVDVEIDNLFSTRLYSLTLHFPWMGFFCNECLMYDRS